MTTESTLNQDATQDASQQQNPAQKTPTEAVNSGSSQSATVSQDHVSKLVGDARKEGKATAIADLLKSLGVASAEELKALKDKAQALEQASMTESQRLEKERDDAKKEKEEALAQLQAERAERRNDRIETELRSALTAAKANNPKTVLSYILVNHRDAMQALMTDEGKIDDKALAALVDKVKQEDSTLFTPPAQVPGSRSNSDGRVMQGDARLREQALRNIQQQIKSNF